MTPTKTKYHEYTPLKINLLQLAFDAVIVIRCENNRQQQDIVTQYLLMKLNLLPNNFKQIFNLKKKTKPIFKTCKAMLNVIEYTASLS